MKKLTAFQEDCLCAIDGLSDPSGQDILNCLTNSALYGNVNHGRLYPNLDKLVRYGFVRKGKHDRRTNYYTLTPDGEEWIRQRQDWRGEIGGETVAGTLSKR